MCNAICECLKCPGRVVCCCCDCAFKMLCGFLCTFIVLAVVIGLIVYFTVFFNKDKSEDQAKMITELVQHTTPQNFRDFFKSVQ